MAAVLPAGLPPPHLVAKALPYLSARVAAASVDGPTAVLPVLQLTLSTLAAARLTGTRVTVPLAPLHAFASLAAEDPDAASLPLLCDALLAYPAEVAVLAPAVAAKVYELPELIDALVGRLTVTPSARTLLATSRLLQALLRAHDEAAALLIEGAERLVPAIGQCYGVIGADKEANRAKAEALTFIRALAHLAGPGAAALRNLVGSRTGGAPLVDGAMADDFDLFNDAHLGDKEATLVRDLHDEERSDDPRLAPLRHLFPSLPQHLLVDALAHPQFAAAGSRATVDEQAAPLVEAILSGTLPIELPELRAAAASISADRQAEEARPEKIERRNVFNDEPLDLSRIRIKGHTDPVVGTEISDNLRASIKRLVQAQAEEAEAAARAVAEAHGTVYRPPGGYEDDDDGDDDLPAARLKLADGDESGASDDDDRTDRSSSPEPPSRSSNTQASQVQAILELAYVRNPSAFNRDSATRRSTARIDLRNATGMDDSQLEGWMIMLERNPHKDAILERHQYARPSLGRDTPNHGKKDGGGGGGRGGKGQNSGGGGSGGGRGGNNNSGGGGRGGRGGNKGSRGHSNAARTRGNDRKMARMGAGL